MFYLRRVLCKPPQNHFAKHISLPARSDENVFKITTWGKNENTDHRVTAPLIPQAESRRSKWRDYYKVKAPASGVSNDWCIILG